MERLSDGKRSSSDENRSEKRPTHTQRSPFPGRSFSYWEPIKMRGDLSLRPDPIVGSLTAQGSPFTLINAIRIQWNGALCITADKENAKRSKRCHIETILRGHNRLFLSVPPFALVCLQPTVFRGSVVPCATAETHVRSATKTEKQPNKCCVRAVCPPMRSYILLSAAQTTSWSSAKRLSGGARPRSRLRSLICFFFLFSVGNLSFAHREPLIAINSR